MQSVNLIADARYTDDKPNVQHAVKTDQLLVDAVYLKPGQKTGWHKHPDADRAYLCLQGSGELVLETAAAGNELRIALAPAALALAPRGVFYDLIAGPQGMVASALSKFPVRVVEKG
jgi:oxalate decarboxylase/phosphoglucose isomerase-like protein (cupin superfamily)